MIFTKDKEQNKNSEQ